MDFEEAVRGGLKESDENSLKLEEWEDITLVEENLPT